VPPIDLGPCVRHPGEPALFRCRQCNDAVCVLCRAAGERDLCSTCGQYRQDSAVRAARVQAGLRPEEPPRQIPWGRYVITVLVALNLGLGGYLVVARQPDVAITRGMQALATVARVVEEHRDPAGRYPASLAPVLPQLPGPVAQLVRDEVIRYETDAGRTTYRVSFVLTPRDGGSPRGKP
jgi:hypothetical protein